MTPDQPILENEEDVKNNLLLPFLETLGIAPDELAFERSFKLQFGHSVYEVKTFEQREKAGARLDILYRKEEQNLFVVEVKGPGIQIHQEDVDQAISYASLVRPIAPFVIVTNGAETRVHDTVSGKKLDGTDIGSQSPFWKNGCRLSLSEELEFRFEALANFIGYSAENLRLFTTSQVAARMRLLKGDAKNLHKKYIPDLYLDRDETRQVFDEFLRDQPSCLTIIGESGVGKTNALCAIAEGAATNYLTLFYNAGDIYPDLASTIRDDFNWFFSPDQTLPQIIRRLDTLAKHAKTQVVIFIDAVDEARSRSFTADLNAFAERLLQFQDTIRLVVSCKSTEWRRFLEVNGSPTTLAECSYSPHPQSSSVSDEGTEAQRPRLPGFVLKRFGSDELPALIERYRSVFKFEGVLSGQLSQECSLGQMLRIVAEVYSGSAFRKG